MKLHDHINEEYMDVGLRNSKNKNEKYNKKVEKE
jgi:hypothetical protein